MNIVSSKKISMMGWVVIAVLYFFTLGSLFVWIVRLTPPANTTITNISIDTADSSLIIEGSNLTENLSAIITPTMQMPQAVLSANSTWSNVRDIAIQGQYAWLANSSSGVLCYDLHKPDLPELKAVMPLNATTWRLAVEGNILLVAAGRAGLFGIDIHIPGNPKLVFTKSDYIVMDLAIKDNIAILATLKHGLVFLDISDIQHPEQLAIIPLASNLQSITIHNNYIYSAGKFNDGGILHAFDITNPLQPRHVATAELPSTVWDCTIFGTQLMLALGSNGVYSCDISVPQKALIPTRTIIDHNAKGLCTHESTMFVTSYSDHVYQYTSNGSQLQQKHTLLLAKKCTTAATYNNLILASQGNDGFVIIDPSCVGTRNGVEVNLPAIQYGKAKMYTFGNNICVSSADTLHLLQVLPDESIAHYDSTDFEESIRTVAMDKKYVYAALNNNQVHIVSLQPTQTQRTQAVLELPHTVKNMNPYGNNLYISLVGSGLVAIDTSNLSTQEPTQILNRSNTHSIRSGFFIYVAAPRNCLEIYRVDKDGKTRLISKFDYSTPLQTRALQSEFIISGNHIIITNGANGLLSIDISNPEKPELVSSLELGGSCNSIVAQDDTACITINFNKIKIVDISDPKRLKELCEIPATRSVAFMHDKLLQLTDQGIAVMPIPQRLPIIYQHSDRIKIRLPQPNTGNYDLQLATQEKLLHYRDLLTVNSKGQWEIAQPLSQSFAEE